MFIDALTLIWDAAALTADAVSTSSIDLGNVTPKRNVGDGEPLAFCISVDVAADHTTGNETYQFNLIQDTAADLATAKDILVERVIDYSLLTAGALHVIPVPPGAVTKRYIGLEFDGGGTTPTITVTAWLTTMAMLQRYQNYAKGYTVS